MSCEKRRKKVSIVVVIKMKIWSGKTSNIYCIISETIEGGLFDVAELNA